MITLDTPLKLLNGQNKGTLMEQLGIEYLEVKEGFIKAKMPVDQRTKQPFDILHGGASLALAETIASLGSAVIIDLEKYHVRGASINANHVGAVSRGYVYGIATLIHKGEITHVWDVEIKDQGGYKISVARVTIVIVKKPASRH
jgi:1,4-dihydroxy-2-naphthoyl-CoA hydrolase